MDRCRAIHISACEIVCIDDGSGSVEALRKIIGHVHTDDFVLISGDIVCDISLKSQILQHRMQKASATILIESSKHSMSTTRPFQRHVLVLVTLRGLNIINFASKSQRLENSNIYDAMLPVLRSQLL